MAETPHRHQVERTFEGMRDIFSAVFFVAIGLQIDVRELWSNFGLILAVGLFTVIARPLAVSTGLTLIGTPLKDAVRTGVTVTPIGEFSFIIAQLGVSAKVIPGKFYPVAVGVCLLTTLAAPLLTRRSEKIADAAVRQQPRWLSDWLRAYHAWQERLRQRGKRNLLWQLSRKRIAQVSVGMLFVTGLVIFSDKLFALVESWLGEDWLFPHGPELIFWTLLVLITLAPLVAIWRNLSAMSLIYAEISTKGHPNAARLKPLVEGGLKLAAGMSLFVWITAILPAEGMTRWLLIFCGVVAVVALLLLRRKLIYWHSTMEVEIMSVIETGDQRMTSTTAPWLQPHGEWNLHMIDCTLPDLADCQGKKISDLELRSRVGCSVVGIERQGYMIPLPPPDAVLYPRDKVLLMGTTEQVNAGKKLLGAVSLGATADSVFEEVRMEALTLPLWSRASGHTLGDLSPARDHNVQIAGVRRGGLRILNPTAHETLRSGDEILVLGAPAHIASFKEWLREKPEDVEAEGEAGTETKTE